MTDHSRRHFLRASSLLPSLSWLLGDWAYAQGGANPQIWVEVDLNNRSNRIGQAIVSGVQNALRELNATKVQLKIINHQGNPDRLIDQLNALALSTTPKAGSILGLVGGGDANLAPLAGRWAAGQELPYAMAWASNPRLIAQINATKVPTVTRAPVSMPAPLMRMAVTDDALFAAFIQWMQSRQERRWGLLLANDVLGRAAYDYILENMELSSAFELVGIQWHSLQAQEIGLHYQTLLRRGAQNILTITHPRAMQVLIQSFNGAHSKMAPLICSSNAWSLELFARTQAYLINLPIYFALPKDVDLIKDHPACVFAQQLCATLLQAPVNGPNSKRGEEITISERAAPFGLLRYRNDGDPQFWSGLKT